MSQDKLIRENVAANIDIAIEQGLSLQRLEDDVSIESYKERDLG